MQMIVGLRKCLVMPEKVASETAKAMTDSAATLRKHVAIAVLRWRSGLGWTQAQAQEHLGVPLRTYQRWETGETPVPAWVLLKMARLSPVWWQEVYERAVKTEAA